MSESKFKTMRHIETVRNYLNTIIKEIMQRQEQHDQTKLQEPEVSIFEEYTPKLKECTYGSDEYKGYLKEMGKALDHHYKSNKHHPEHFNDNIKGMNLIDIIEMLVDWKSAGLRHSNGDILKSIDLNQERFGYTDELKQIFINTVKWLDEQSTYHLADES